jgi:hypothetical protein
MNEYWEFWILLRGAKSFWKFFWVFCFFFERSQKFLKIFFVFLKWANSFRDNIFATHCITMLLSADQRLESVFCLVGTRSNEWNELEVSDDQVASWDNRRVSKLRSSNTHREAHQQCNETLHRKHTKQNINCLHTRFQCEKSFLVSEEQKCILKLDACHSYDTWQQWQDQRSHKSISELSTVCVL